MVNGRAMTRDEIQQAMYSLTEQDWVDLEYIAREHNITVTSRDELFRSVLASVETYSNMKQELLDRQAAGGPNVDLV